MEYHLGHGNIYGKLKLMLVGCLILIIIAVIVHFNYLRVQYYAVTLNWEKAIEVIDQQIISTKNEEYKDQLLIYRMKILGAMSKAADVLSRNSQRLLDDEEKFIHSKYQKLLQTTLQECNQSLEQLNKIAEKCVNFKTVVRLSPIEYTGQYRKLTIKQSEKFFRQLVGNYFYLDLSLTNMKKFGWKIKYVSGVFNKEGLAESFFYAVAD